jgi:signal transduction histidine kinase
MKRRNSMLSLGAVACVVLALLAVFAIELSNTQAKSKLDVMNRVHERAVLAGALIDSLFQSVEQQIPQEARTYGARTVTARAMNTGRQGDVYVVLLDAKTGRVIAHSRGFTPQARADLRDSAALALVSGGHRYGLGDVRPYGATGVINLAAALPTRSGPRVFVTGFMPGVLGTFITGELQKIPGVPGAHNYLIDGRNTVLASTNPAVAVGHVFDTPVQLRALSRSSGDSNGSYYDQVGLSSSTWRIVLTAPDGPLFATVTGVRKWVPWIIFIAFGFVALVALVLSRRVLKARDALGGANERLAVVNDELASMNAKLAQRASELARSNGELEQFAAIASHDLQEPLRKIRTFTEQLTVIESNHLTDKGRDYLQRTNAAAERMQMLIQDLLKFSRVASKGRPFALLELERVCREVLKDLDYEVEQAGAVVRLGKLPAVTADSLQMRQLFQNLISNALKFRLPGTTPEISIDASVTDGIAAIIVRDNGIGFDPQYSRRIFRIFERLHSRSAYPGTGIGLALCRKIAERHGGTVTAESAPGAGSTFTVTIPIDQGEEVIVAHRPEGNGELVAREETYVTA